MTRLLGIDFGLVRIGLAISDNQQKIALPIGMIRAVKNVSETIRLIQQQIARYPDIESIIIGLPLQLNGKEGQMAIAVRSFAQSLEEILSLPLIFWDERLTSAQVDRSLKDVGMNRKKRAQHSDEYAATTILQNYLDLKNNHILGFNRPLA